MRKKQRRQRDMVEKRGRAKNIRREIVCQARFIGEDQLAITANAPTLGKTAAPEALAWARYSAQSKLALSSLQASSSSKIVTAHGNVACEKIWEIRRGFSYY